MFTDIEGAKANLPRFLVHIDNPDFQGFLSVEVYLRDGSTRTVSTIADGRRLLASLEDMR